MATNKEILQSALNNIKVNKAAAITARKNEILTNEINPAIAEKRNTFDKAWAEAKKELDKDIQALKDDGAARAEAEIETEYAAIEDGIQKLIGE